MSGTGRRVLGRTVLVVLGMPALVAVGCASPEPSYYRLTAVPGAPRTAGSGTVKLRRVGLPGYLDRPEIVRAGVGGRLDLGSTALWAEPLDSMLERVLVENLGQRLPGATVFGAGSTLTADADRTVEVEIRRFEADAAGAVELAAQVALLLGRGGAGTPRILRATSPVTGEGTAAVATAMSAVLGGLSDQLAALLAVPGRATRRGSAPAA